MTMIKSTIKPHPIEFESNWFHEKSDSDLGFDRSVKPLMTATAVFMPLECPVMTSKPCPAHVQIALRCCAVLCSDLTWHSITWNSWV